MKSMAEKRAEELDKYAKSMLQIVGSSNCTPDGIMTVSHGLKARLLQLNSTDLSFLDDDDLADWLDAFTNMNRVYTDPYKYFSLSSRIDTSENQQYWHRLRSRLGTSYQERLRARLISENLDRVIQVEQQTDKYSELNFYVMIFGKSVRELRNKTHLLEVSDSNGTLGFRTLNYDETQELEFSLHNPNWK